MLHMIALLVMLVHPPNPQLDCNLRYWQPRLGLNAWHVTIALVPAAELEPNALGQIDCSLLTKTAVIRILGADDYDLPRRLTTADQQLTLLHELVHLHRRVLGEPGWQEETPTNQQTLALLYLYHRHQELAAIEHP